MKLISETRFLELTKNFSQIKPILVVGDIGVDKYTLGEVRRISPEAPIPILEVSKEWMKLGLAANVSDNLQGLGVNSTLCGVIGDDSNGNLLEELMEEEQLKTWGLVRDKGRMTTFKERVTTQVQQICRIDYESKEDLNADILESMLRRIDSFAENHSAVILEDYGKGVFSEKLCQYTIQKFKSLGKIVAVDPSRSTPPQWYRGADLLKPNFLESQLMAEALGFRDHHKNIEKIAELLLEKLQLKKLIITLGPEGMALIDTQADGKLKYIPTVATEVFDVSGAGDTAISAITTTLVAGGTLEEAAWIGNCASGVVVGIKGTARTNVDELTEFYRTKVLKVLRDDE